MKMALCAQHFHSTKTRTPNADVKFMQANETRSNNAAMRRLNAKEAAAELNVSTWTVLAMKKAGAPFTGRYCTLLDLDAWWRANPSFCASRVWRTKKASIGQD